MKLQLFEMYLDALLGIIPVIAIVAFAVWMHIKYGDKND